VKGWKKTEKKGKMRERKEGKGGYSRGLVYTPHIRNLEKYPVVNAKRDILAVTW